MGRPWVTRLFCCALCQAKGGTGEQQKEQHFKRSSALMESKEWVDKGAETSLFHLNFGSTPGRKLNLRTHSLDTSSKAQSLLLHFSNFYNSLLHFFPLSYNFFPFLLQPHHWQHCSHRDTCSHKPWRCSIRANTRLWRAAKAFCAVWGWFNSLGSYRESPKGSISLLNDRKHCDSTDVQDKFDNKNHNFGLRR